MLQSIKRAHKLNPEDAKLHTCLIRFYEVMQKNKEGWDPVIEEVIAKETEVLFGGKNADELNTGFLQRNSNMLEATLEGARMLYYLDPKNKSSAVSLVTNVDNKFVDVNIEVSIRYNSCSTHVLFRSKVLVLPRVRLHFQARLFRTYPTPAADRSLTSS